MSSERSDSQFPPTVELTQGWGRSVERITKPANVTGFPVGIYATLILTLSFSIPEVLRVIFCSKNEK